MGKEGGHPCFDEACRTYARMHLPVAPACNIQCNYCLRQYDCMNECRPGVCSRILSVDEAVARYRQVRAHMPHLSVVGFAGPGDALENFASVSAGIKGIRKFDADVQFCLSTNGLRLPEFLPQLAALGVGYLSVTVEAMTADAGAQIYEHVEWQGNRLWGKEAFRRLHSQQLIGLRCALEQGIRCKVNTVVIPGVNEEEAVRIAKWAGMQGCHMQNLMPLIPVKGSAFEHFPPCTPAQIAVLRRECGRYIRQMTHCRHCRADAVGNLI